MVLRTEVVLEGLLARGEGVLDLLAGVVVRSGGKLGLQLRLEGSAYTRVARVSRSVYASMVCRERVC